MQDYTVSFIYCIDWGKYMLITKYQGCGNDFIIIKEEELVHVSIRDFVRNVCDRHTGIGADGCIIVKQQPLTMLYYNQDGNMASMCGNGLRCFVHYCYDEKIQCDEEYKIKTSTGELTIQRLSLTPFTVRINMGTWNDDPSKIYVQSKTSLLPHSLLINNHTFPIYSFFLSTIHSIVFVDEIPDINYHSYASDIAHHHVFQKQTNVSFVKIINSTMIQIETYERGVGWTLSCGSGACASARIAYEYKHCANHIDIVAQGGILHVDINSNHQVYLNGISTKILKGEYFYE